MYLYRPFITEHFLFEPTLRFSFRFMIKLVTAAKNRLLGKEKFLFKRCYHSRHVFCVTIPSNQRAYFYE